MTTTLPSTVPDFPDWLSPILIKELRQGMRTRIFALTFITVQVLMIASVGFGLLLTASDIPAQVASGFFWLMIGVPILLVLPMSGFKAISGEVTAQTLELIQLTHLDAWRIMWGKWLAIVAQALLLVCAVLPYAVLRYFMGGVNMLDDLLGLAFMVLTSATLTAVMVGLSTLENRLSRILIVVGFIFALQFVFPILAAGLFARAGMSGPLSGLPGGFSLSVVAVVACFFIIVLMLKIGAGRIAPPSENHVTVKRLMGVVMWAAALLVAWTLPNFFWLGFLALIGCLPIFVGALIEEEPQSLNIYRSFAKRGILGRLSGRILYPGWPAGVAYIGVMLLGFLLFLPWRIPSNNPFFFVLLFVAVLDCFLVPALLLRLLPLRGDSAAMAFVVFQAIGLFLGMVAAGLASSTDFPITEVAALHPLAAVIGLLKMGASAPSDIWKFLPALALTTGATVLAFSFYWIPAWRRMRERERQSISVNDELA